MKQGRTLALLVSLVVALAAIGSNQSASAHPVYLDSEPKASQNVPSSPNEVNVYFSEPIELDYSKISVLGEDGSRVDKNDKHYVHGDTSTIGVSLQPSLAEGQYTVTTRVLSAVDGHVIEETFIFGVGTSIGPPPVEGRAQILAPEYAASRFPGMVGQVMAVGAAFGALWLWKPLTRVPWLSERLAATKVAADRTMMKIVIIGAGLVLASGVAMIIVQAISIEASVQAAIATKFGNVWITRMLQAAILMGIAASVYRRIAKNNVSPSRGELYAIFIIGLAVLVTSSLIAHAAATEQVPAIVLDFFHNAAASIWIGGIILFGFAIVPKLLSMGETKVQSAVLSILIPRFSTIVVTLLGISVITGPLLLAAIESDLSLTLASVYGQILAIKLGLAGAMILMGAYSQFVVQKRAVMVFAGGSEVTSPRLMSYSKILKAEAGIGIALLLAVSFMANGALPSGQFPGYQKQTAPDQAFAEEIDTTFSRTAFIPDGRITLSVAPFALGQNNFEVSFLDNQGDFASGIQSARFKMTQVERGIGPITVEMTKQSEGRFTSHAAFSLPGVWAIDIEGINSQGNNMISTFNVQVKPLVRDLEFSIKQYKTPEMSLPLFPVFDGLRQSIWVGDSLPGSGRFWMLDIATGNYTEYKLADVNLVTQSVLDKDGTLWFIDPLNGVLGHYYPQNNSTELHGIPDQGVPSGLAMDLQGNLWVPVVQANTIVKFDVQRLKFDSFPIPTPGSTPVGIAADKAGNLWFAEASGSIAKVDPSSGNITEFRPEPQRFELDEPTAVFPDPRGGAIYISEHTGHTISQFNTLLETFREYPTVNEGGLPFGMAMDTYGNLWFAEHQIDRLGVIDPRTGASTEVKIPITGSFIQWITADDEGRIWFAAQRGASLGSVAITAKPASPGPDDGGEVPAPSPIKQLGFSLADVAGPAIAAGIVISALAYAKSATDLRSNSRLVLRNPAKT